MTLPPVVLDDRRSQDIVDEAKRKIPTLFPAWTNHNVSDPGVALIELFAWMTDMTLFRLNRLPERGMVALLNTVGFRPFPARAARTDLTFSISGEPHEPVVVPARTQVGTTAGGDGQVVFETERELILRQPKLERCLAARTAATFDDRTDEIRDPKLTVECFSGLARLLAAGEASIQPGDRFDGDAIYFGFSESLADSVVRLVLKASIDGEGINPDDPPIVWEASTVRGFVPCERVRDSTRGLNAAGEVVLVVPRDHARTQLGTGGEILHWIGLRVDSAKCPMYASSPRITTPVFSTVGGVVSAQHAEAQPETFLGVSDETPGQRFRLPRHPILPCRDQDRLVVTDVAGSRDDGWSEVTDFGNETGDSKVYSLDPTTGEVSFGPSVMNPRGEPTQRGAIPPLHSHVSFTSYLVGGGVRGNVPAGSIGSLRATVRSIAGVVNRTAATGGADAESYEKALERAPMALRAGDRAVTAEDHVRIVRDAGLGIARIEARAPHHAGESFRLLIVPTVATEPSAQKIDDYALPTELAAGVVERLEPCRLVGSRCLITTPYYVGVSAAVRVVALQPERSGPEQILRGKVEAALYHYVNPIIGGVHKRGLPFDTAITAAQVEAIVRSIDGVDDVEVELFQADARREMRFPGPGSQRIELPPDSLFMSFRHSVVVVAKEPVR